MVLSNSREAVVSLTTKIFKVCMVATYAMKTTTSITVIEAYLHLIASTSISKGVKVEILEWEVFEKGFSKGAVKELLKGKAPLMEQDCILIPCNSGRSEHWFLLAVLPKEKQMLVLDSMAGSFTKPSVHCSRLTAP